MKRNLTGWIALALVAACLLTMAGCGEKPESVDGAALYQVLLEEVTFDTPMEDKGNDAYLYFSGLPENTVARLHSGSAYFADALALVKVQKDADMEAAEAAVDAYLAQVRNQYVSYLPDQVEKIDNAVIWKQSPYIIVCITSDTATARSIVDNAAEKTAGVTVKEPSLNTPADIENSGEKEGPQQNGSQEQTPSKEYPQILSQSGTYDTYGTVAYRVDDMAYEIYLYDHYAAENYAEVINGAAAELAGKADVYVMAIPTSIGVVFPDDMKDKVPDYSDQNLRIQNIYDMIDDSVKKVNIMDNLMQHRDEYLYFHTDTHWTALGAYYAYETLCQIQGVEPYTLDQRQKTEFSGFRGVLYQEVSGKDSKLATDTVEAYYPHSSRVTMVYTDRDGVEHDWQIITDVSNWSESSKYNTFGAGDNPLTVYNNPDVSKVRVGLLIKESFGNALIPYLVDHYTVLYEIDYRYWEGDIAEFVQQMGVDDVIFANNMGMIRSGLLVGMLADNF